MDSGVHVVHAYGAVNSCLAISGVCSRQREEMERAVQNLGGAYTDDQINRLAQRHFDNIQVTSV